MTVDKLDVLGGALREGGYRSGAAFLERFRRAHVEAGGEISEALRLQFRGAIRASLRGVGPVRRAEAFTVASLVDASPREEPAVPGGPCAPGRFEVHDDGRTVSIDLSATKTDPAGRGRARAHRCICCASAAIASCPACAARLQVITRTAQGARADDLLFADGKGGVVTKAAASDTLRALLAASGPGRISGHSMWRTGTQLLTAAGVEPWLVQWFGRWGSAAMLAYIEDV